MISLLPFHLVFLDSDLTVFYELVIKAQVTVPDLTIVAEAFTLFFVL